MLANFIICTVCLISISHAGLQLHWTKQLQDNLVGMKIRQLVIYENNTENETTKKHKNSVLQELARSIPSTIIDLARNCDENQTLSCLNDKYYHPQSEQVIFLQQESDEDDSRIMNFLNFYVRLYPKKPRKKCLVIHFSNSDKKTLRKILMFAWQKKFLDSTVLEVLTTENEAFVNTFDPFHEIFKKVELSKKVKFFPYKLRNLNGYPITIPIYTHQPYIKVIKNSNDTLKLENFIYDSVLLKTFEEMNFNVKTYSIDYFNKSVARMYSDIFNKLENHNLSMGIVPLPLSVINQSVSSLIINFNCFRYIGIMRSQSKVKFEISVRNLINCFLILATLFIIKWAIYFFDSSTLRGKPGRSPPKILSKKVMELVGFFGSMLLSAKFVAFLTKIVQVNDAVSFNSIDEVYRSDYKLVSSSISYKAVLNSLDDSSKILFSRFFKVNDTVKCPYYAVENEKTICLTTPFRAEEALKSSEELSQTMTILSFDLACEKIAYPFEKASPYIEHFKRFFQNMCESGIFYKLAEPYRVDYKLFKNISKNEEFVNLLALSQGFIVTVGMSISFLAFGLEIVIYRFADRRNSKFSKDFSQRFNVLRSIVQMCLKLGQRI